MDDQRLETTELLGRVRVMRDMLGGSVTEPLLLAIEGDIANLDDMNACVLEFLPEGRTQVRWRTVTGVDSRQFDNHEDHNAVAFYRQLALRHA